MPLKDLILQALELRSGGYYALHPVEAVIRNFCAATENRGDEGNRGSDFKEAEAHYRAGAQGVRLSEIPQLPRQLRELSRLSTIDRAGRRSLRRWAEDTGRTIDEAEFLTRWLAQGGRGGAEHQVYHDERCGRWFKRLYLTGILAHDLHDENVVRLPGADGLAVIDPHIALTRLGTWAALKLEEAGFETPSDDSPATILSSHPARP